MNVTHRRYSLDERSLAAYCSVLEWAERSRVTITRTKIAKLLYLADLSAVASGDTPVTNIRWQWLDHGPYSNALMFAENELAGDGSVERERVPYIDHVGTHLRLVDCEHAPLDEDSAMHLSRTLDQYGRMTAGTIKDVTYQTDPMLAAQEGGRRGVVLDLELAKPRFDRRALRAKYRGILAREDDRGERPQGAADEVIVDVMDEFRDARRAASTELLDP